MTAPAGPAELAPPGPGPKTAPQAGPLVQYTTQARTGGPAAALHAAGLVLVVIAAAGALGSLALPAVRNSPQPGR